MTEERIVRIGGASGAFIDSALAVPQLLTAEKLDYLVFDYLAEGSMAIFARMMAANPESGFMQEFIDVHIGPYLVELRERGIKVIANAGGLNPKGLAAALTPEAVGAWYRHFLDAETGPQVDRYDVPGFHAINFVVHNSLAGGINDSPRLDPAAKGMAQQLPEFPISVPPVIAAASRGLA